MSGRGPSRARTAGASVIVLSLALGSAGCGTSRATGTPVASAAATPSAPTPSAPTSPAPTAPGPTGTGPIGSPAVQLDPSLLAILPPAVDGIPVTQEPESFSEALADADFVANVQAAAFALVVDGGDLASGVVARLRPGVYSDAFFRDWRDTYSQGACSQASGVTGTAEAQLGGRTVYITNCAGGMLVYDAYLPGPGVVVSLFSWGARRFGERLMSDLRP